MTALDDLTDLIAGACGDQVAQRFASKVWVEPNTGCWLWSGALSHGHGQMWFRGKTCYLTRVIWTLLHEDPAELWLLHHCDTRACINPAHLYLGTNQDNVNDRTRRGGQFSKLTESDVLTIRRSPTRLGTELAREFGVSFQRISQIRRGDGWKHVVSSAETPATTLAALKAMEAAND